MEVRSKEESKAAGDKRGNKTEGAEEKAS